MNNERAERLAEAVENSLNMAMENQSKATNETLSVPGFSSNWIRHFLNNLCGSIAKVNYLEVGLYRGSTFVNALAGNLDNVNVAYGIDNWSEFEGNKEECVGTIRRLLDDPKVMLFDTDCFEFDLAKVSDPIDVFFYDGNHSEVSQMKAFTYFNPVLTDTFIAIVDDWNWDFVRNGTRKAFETLGYKVIQEFEMLTPDNGWAQTWWNGLFVAVIQK